MKCNELPKSKLLRNLGCNEQHIINSVVDFFNDSLQEVGQYTVLSLDQRLMRCDPVRIRQALLALLEDAKQHAIPGVIRIQTCIEHGKCYLRVEDDGPGIPADLMPYVFEAFRRRETMQGGSGLGLSVVAAIAHAHSGQALCRSSTSGGTIFELNWPNNFRALSSY